MTTQKDVHELAVSKGWWEKNPNIPEKVAMVHSEVSEFLEAWRNDRPKVDQASELADIVIRVMDLAQFMGIDLQEAITIKHTYNTTRKYRHGGKRC